jgi:hypothetical protein
MELHSMSVNYFTASGFLRNPETNRLVYFSFSDIRHWRNAWHNNILFRSAQHDKDWTGGSNRQATLDSLVADAKLQSEREWF